MKAITYSVGREGLASAMDEVCRDRAPMMDVRDRGQTVVMLSLDDGEELEETTRLSRRERTSSSPNCGTATGEEPNRALIQTAEIPALPGVPRFARRRIARGQAECRLIIFNLP